jgi:heptosyltransferase-2
MARTLIVKLGALGDVLRTTCLLRALDGEIHWLTSPAAMPLLRGNPFLTAVHTPETVEELTKTSFDLVLNLEDDAGTARLVERIPHRRLAGAYLGSGGRMAYTDEAAAWFDMGLISRYGLDRANELKKTNTRTYQDMLFEMAGLRFRGEEYVLDRPAAPANDRPAAGIEVRAGDRWRFKKWDKYDALERALRAAGHPVVRFQQRDDLLAYVEDVNRCDVIVCGDTLAMHLGLALGKRVAAVFGPTPADEIYGYGRLHKVVAPLDCIKCYKRDCDFAPNCMESIQLEDVLGPVLGMLAATNATESPSR